MNGREIMEGENVGMERSRVKYMVGVLCREIDTVDDDDGGDK